MNSICPINFFRTTDTTDTTDTTIWKPGFTHMYIGRTTTLSTFIRYLSLLVSHTRAQGATTPQQAFVINGTCEETQQRFSEILVNYAIWNSITLKKFFILWEVAIFAVYNQQKPREGDSLLDNNTSYNTPDNYVTWCRWSQSMMV